MARAAQALSNGIAVGRQQAAIVAFLMRIGYLAVRRKPRKKIVKRFGYYFTPRLPGTMADAQLRERLPPFEGSDGYRAVLEDG